MTKEEFIEYVYKETRIRLTDNQFSGKDKIYILSTLNLYGLTEIPENFSLNVNGNLELNSLTHIPNGFKPRVEYSLDLRSVTSISNGFNPVVGNLRLDSLTHIQEGFNPKKFNFYPRGV